jgi:hypothetical protein
MWPISRLSQFMKDLFPLTQALCGLMATGVIAAEDTYTTADTGQGRGLAVRMHMDRGNIHPAATGGTEVVGAKAPRPAKGGVIKKRLLGEPIAALLFKSSPFRGLGGSTFSPVLLSPAISSLYLSLCQMLQKVAA